MHILVTDVLTCPRCGPAFGLILLADTVTERRVRSGRLGCSNCREKYPITDGAVEFAAGAAAPEAAVRDGAGTRDDAAPGPAGAEDGEAVVRLAALLGLQPEPSWALLAGPAVRHAEDLAALVPGPEVLAVNGGTRGGNGVTSLSVAGDRLPLASGKIHGVALSGDAADSWLEEGARIVSPVGRLLLDPAPADTEARLTAAGLRVAARQGDVVLASRVI